MEGVSGEDHLQNEATGNCYWRFEERHGVQCREARAASIDEVPVIVDAAPVVAEGDLPAGPGVHVPEERQLYIRKNVELVRHGYTEGCQGCNAARAGSAARAHSAECRVRITSAMEGRRDGLGARHDGPAEEEQAEA